MSMRRRAALAQMNYADVAGLQVDFENSIFTRLAGARGRTAGADFDCFAPFGGRRRCCVSDDGTINAFYGEAGYAEDGSNGQVMVYQPKFYYRVEPLQYASLPDESRCSLKKVNYYVSPTRKPGFKLHPAFYGANGNEIDYVMFSAYEASYYDDSLGRMFNDGTDTETETDTVNDRLCSVAGQKAICGKYKNLTRANAETLAGARGAGWHIDTIKGYCANLLLMIVEYGAMNLQEALGMGVVSLPGSSSERSAVFTGSTAALGNRSGMASSTIGIVNGVMTSYTGNGKTSVSYRGIENPWGNLWKFVAGINLWGDKTKNGGLAFICRDYQFTDNKTSGNYESTGLQLANENGNVSAMAYSEPFDWLFFASETNGNSSLPVGDYQYISSNLNGYRIAYYGGEYSRNQYAGPFAGRYIGRETVTDYVIGARIFYCPGN